MIPINITQPRRSQLIFGFANFILILLSIFLTRECSFLERKEIDRLKNKIAQTEYQNRILNQIGKKYINFLQLSHNLDSLAMLYPQLKENKIEQSNIRSNYRTIESKMDILLADINRIVNGTKDTSQLALLSLAISKRLKSVQIAYAENYTRYIDRESQDGNVADLQQKLSEANSAILDVKIELATCVGAKTKGEIDASNKDINKVIELQRLNSNINLILAFLNNKNAKINGLTASEVIEIQRKLEIMINKGNSRP